MLDELGYTLGGLVDRLKEAAGVLTSDPMRLGALALGAIIVFAVIIGSAYTINISASVTGKSLTWVCPATDSYILPILTSPTNMSAAFPAIQCTISNGDFLAVIFYLLEVVGIVFLGAYLGIAILNLSG